jgi:uncharacterized metal-binding protein
MSEKKISIAPCSGMSPYGLVARAASSDTVAESENVVSICMTATSADVTGFRNLISKYPIIAINGCENTCVDKILEQKGVKVSKTINVMELLNQEELTPTDVVRLDEQGEKCVEAVKKKLKKILEDKKTK